MCWQQEITFYIQGASDQAQYASGAQGILAITVIDEHD